MPESNEPVMQMPLTIEQFEAIYENLQARMEEYPDEGLHESLLTTLTNAGDEWTVVRCLGGEWSSTKADLPVFEVPDIPMCPNGHQLNEEFGLKLGWVSGDKPPPIETAPPPLAI